MYKLLSEWNETLWLITILFSHYKNSDHKRWRNFQPSELSISKYFNLCLSMLLSILAKLIVNLWNTNFCEKRRTDEYFSYLKEIVWRVHDNGTLYQCQVSFIPWGETSHADYWSPVCGIILSMDFGYKCLTCHIQVSIAFEHGQPNASSTPSPQCGFAVLWRWSCSSRTTVFDRSSQYSLHTRCFTTHCV